MESVCFLIIMLIISVRGCNSTATFSGNYGGVGRSSPQSGRYGSKSGRLLAGPSKSQRTPYPLPYPPARVSDS